MTNKETLKIAAYPFPIALADVEKNLAAVDEAISSLPDDIDLLVLPELFSTGFIQEETLLHAIAQDASTATLQALKRWSSERGLAIAGSFLHTVDNEYRNRGFIMEPSEKVSFYDKRHLFCLSNESSVYARGKSPSPVVDYLGWKISLAICYDLRFPVWCRNGRQQYDILIVPANWPSARGYAFKHLLIARAIENQAYVVGCNRSGHDDYGDYDNETFIFNPFGYEMAPTDTTASKGIVRLDETGKKNQPAQRPADMIQASFSKEHLLKTRTYLPVSRDADSFSIEL